MATAASLCLVGHWSHLVAEVGDQAPVVVEDRLEPTDFSPEELKLLQRRFGVHGPQTQLAQLFTSGVDQLQPLRLMRGHEPSADGGNRRTEKLGHAGPRLVAHDDG